MILQGGLIFNPRAGFSPGELCFDGGVITSSAVGETLDFSGCFLIPGLTDLHFHGCMGADLSDADPKGLERMAEYELSRGVTQICPAGMTLLPEQLVAMCKMAAEHRAAGRPGAELVGINLEGPFLSRGKKGAQNGDWLLAPDFDLLEELNAASKGLAKLVTLAPELPGAIDFIKKASDKIVVSLGHTETDFATAEKAFAAGARQVTHLYNAMPSFLHREPGLIGAAADCENAMVELICDGVHVHPAVVRATFKLFGRERICLISDTMRAAGMPEGEYTLGGQKVLVSGNRPVLEDGTIAGSATDLMRCMKTVVSFGIPLADAVTAAAVNPAKTLGIYHRTGSLEPGKEANIAVLDRDLELKAVFFKGERVF